MKKWIARREHLNELSVEDPRKIPKLSEMSATDLEHLLLKIGSEITESGYTSETKACSHSSILGLRLVNLRLGRQQNVFPGRGAL